MKIKKNMIWIVVFLALSGTSEGLCPPSEFLAPLCTCRDMNDDSFLKCSNVFDANDLFGPMKSVQGNKYKIYSLQIYNSSLVYLPHNLLWGTGIEKILFFKSEIMSLSDSDTAFEGLEDSLSEIRAIDAHYVAEWDFNQLQLLKKLVLVEVKNVVMNELSQPLPALRQLDALGITEAEVSSVADYAFAKLDSLRILNLRGNHIREVKRNMLPEPAKSLEVIDLSKNELHDLPKNFFTLMPLLKHLSLAQNKFLTLKEDTFSWPFVNLHSLSFFGNKFQCDCQMRWITGRRKPYDMLGTCSEPKALEGKSLLELEYLDIKC